MIIIRSLKLEYQTNNYDCGISCLLSILKYYKCDVSKDYLIQKSMTTKEGTSMYGLMLAATSLGFKSYGKKGDILKISQKSIPFIAHIKINENKGLFHYVIISTITSKKVKIKDPNSGTKELSIEEFKKITTNNYLFIEKTNKVKNIIRKKIIKKEWNNLIIKNRKIIIILILATLINIILELLNLFSLKIILNNAIIIKSLQNLIILITCFLNLLILKTGLKFLINLGINKLCTIFNYKLKTLLIKQLLSLPNLYYQTKKKGIIISLFNDIDFITDYLLSSSFAFINSFIMLIFIYTFFSSLSKTMTFILVIANIVLLLFIFSQKRINKKIILTHYKIKDAYNTKLQQIVTKNEKIKGLHLENTIYKSFKKLTNLMSINNYKLAKYREIIQNTLVLLEGLIYLTILSIGGMLLITSENITLPNFLLVESLIFIGLRNMETLILIIFKYENYKKSKERLNDIFDYQKEILLLNSHFNYQTKNLTILITNLTYKYYDNIILNNINLKINAKDKIFIYGPSGSGKSTLVKLLARILPVEYNHIKLGKIDITHYNLEDLRKIVTYISNEEILDNDSIKENIYLSRKPILNQDILISITGLKKLFTEKKYDLNTIIEENGENLSMGERSRINLAQGLLKQSEIYILDECLCNVDIALEKEILNKLIKFYQDKIIIYISHRTVNKDLFNRVLYFKKGKYYEKKL